MKSNCASCGSAFSCGVDERDQKCWCAKRPACAIDLQKKSCLCPPCLDRQLKKEGALRCFRLHVAYDGGDYSGFQQQANARSIEEELKTAFFLVTGQQMALTVAGRTDAGVHARGQALSVELMTNLSSRQLTLALAAKLPKSISVWRIDEMPTSFDARRQSVGKQYIYRIYQGLVPHPFYYGHSLFVRANLDVDAMSQAAKHFEGEHDFISFRSVHCTARHAVRYLWRVSVNRSGPVIEVDVRGNAFCLNMVRIIVGTLIEVGKGKRSPESIKQILADRDRRKAGITAKPQGLTLERVYYPDDLSDAGIPKGARFPRFPVSDEHWGISCDDIDHGPV